MAARILPADDAAIAEAARIILAGGLVGMPTETVYGLAADARNGRAVAGIYAAKGRPSFNPLIIHLPSLDAARELADLDASALELARVFWPGPLTLVAPRRPGCPVSELATAGLDTIALRVPGHPVAQALLRAAAAPLAAPSANRSEELSPTRAQDVADSLGARVDLILDGGPCLAGLESTIIACVGGEVRQLRPGAIARTDIARVLGRDIPRAGPHDAVSAPGMMRRHYAPRARLRLNALHPEAGEAWLAFGDDPAPGWTPAANLSPAGDAAEAAANLFALLRLLDGQAGRIAVARIPAEGLGEAINDRLSRAAAS